MGADVFYYVLGLIAYKLLKAQRQLHQHGVLTTGHDSLSRRIMRIITESAALYSLNHLLYAVLYEVKTYVESTPSYLVSPSHTQQSAKCF